MTTRLLIDAVVAATECPALAAVASQLRECLHAATGQRLGRARYGFVRRCPRFPATSVRHSWSVCRRPNSKATTTRCLRSPARWHAQLSALPGVLDPPPVLLCMLFRHVPGGGARTCPRPAGRNCASVFAASTCWPSTCRTTPVPVWSISTARSRTSAHARSARTTGSPVRGSRRSRRAHDRREPLPRGAR